jgi:hypothetical protein
MYYLYLYFCIHGGIEHDLEILISRNNTLIKDELRKAEF